MICCSRSQLKKNPSKVSLFSSNQDITSVAINQKGSIFISYFPEGIDSFTYHRGVEKKKRITDRCVWGMIFDQENKLYFKERIGNHTGAISRMNFADEFIKIFSIDNYDCYNKSLKSSVDGGAIYAIISNATIGVIFNVHKYKPEVCSLELDGDMLREIVPFGQNEIFAFFRNGNYSYVRFEFGELKLGYSEDQIPVRKR